MKAVTAAGTTITHAIPKQSNSSTAIVPLEVRATQVFRITLDKETGHKSCQFLDGRVCVAKEMDANGSTQHGAITFSKGGGLYVGPSVKGEPHGRGHLTLSNGVTYEGDFQNGLEHGNGYMKWPKDGVEYVGQFKDGYRDGRGRLQFANGQIYEGDFQRGKPHGNGELTFASKNKYVGQFIDGDMSGYGRWEGNDGEVYNGQFQKDKRHGMGLQKIGSELFSVTYFDGNEISRTKC